MRFCGTLHRSEVNGERNPADPREILRELALSIAVANGTLRAWMALGRPTAALEIDYQDAVMAFDKALDELAITRREA